jgi:hypothetical protein
MLFPAEFQQITASQNEIQSGQIAFCGALDHRKFFGHVELSETWCELSALWSHFMFGVMEPVKFRHKGATLFPA